MVWAKNNFGDYNSRGPPNQFYNHERDHRMPHPSSNCLGVAEISIQKVIPKQLVVGWYKLFPADIYDPQSDSN